MIIPQTILSLIVGSAVFMVVYAMFGSQVAPEPPIHRRIAQKLGFGRQTIFENPVLQPLLALGLTISRRFNWPSLRARVRNDLNALGNPAGYSVDEYLALCLVTALVVGVASIAFEALSGTGLFLFAGPVFAAIGFAAPLIALRSSAATRVRRIAKQLPYTLDLISLTMAAGSTFTEAIQTLIRDDPDEDLNSELATVLAEIDYGTPRADALTNLGQRIDLESLRSIVGAINQAEALGTPLSVILKLQSEMLRNQRSVRAEKLSASASLRILIPSMLILAAVVLIIFGPFIIRWLRGDLLF